MYLTCPNLYAKFHTYTSVLYLIIRIYPVYSQLFLYMFSKYDREKCIDIHILKKITVYIFVRLGICPARRNGTTFAGDGLHVQSGHLLSCHSAAEGPGGRPRQTTQKEYHAGDRGWRK